jgi:hypothetical protein
VGQPGLAELVVVVARHEGDALAGERGGEALEQRAHQLQQGGERPLAQLERVAQQHQPVGPLDCRAQPLQRARPSQHVRLVQRAQVEIRDDRRPHPGGWCRMGSPPVAPASRGGPSAAG